MIHIDYTIPLITNMNDSRNNSPRFTYQLNLRNLCLYVWVRDVCVALLCGQRTTL